MSAVSPIAPRRPYRTPLRTRALAVIQAEQQAGRFVSLGWLTRELGLYDYRDARRVVRDLRSMGHAV